MKMKKIFASVVSLAMLASMAVLPVAAKTFPDTTEHWAENAISVWSDNSIVNGDDQGNFRPNDSITRAETATILDNMIGYTKQSVKVFSDVSKSDWFAYSISRLYQAGVITGYEDGTIAPNNSISRQEAVVMMSRAFGFKVDGADTSVLDNFSDKDLIGDWAANAVAFMASRGYVQGNDGQFRPTAQITRAEIVTIVDNIVGIYANGTQNTYSGDFGNKIAVIKDNATFNGVTLGGVVVSPSFTGRANFNNNSKVNGHLMDLSSDSTVSVAGAKVESQTAPNKNTTTTPSYSTGGSYSSGGSSGSSSSSSSSTKTYTITYNANGGVFDDDEETCKVSYKSGRSFQSSAPDDPTYEGYKFIGWYYKSYEPDEAESGEEVDMKSTYVTANDIIYAGWEKVEPTYGSITAATDDEFSRAEEFMTDVKVTANKNSETKFTAKGTLNYVEYAEYEGLDKEGNFIVLTYTLPSTLSSPGGAVVKSYYDDVEDSKETYDKFSKNNLTYTRVFNVPDSAIDIVFAVDFDGDGSKYDEEELTVDISDVELAKKPNPVAEVTTEKEFKDALENNFVESIVIKSDIDLVTNSVYGFEAKRKTVVANNKLTVPADSNVAIKNLDFVTSTTETEETTTAITVEKGAKVEITGNSFDGLTTAVLINGAGDIEIKENAFLDNTVNIKSIAVGEIEDYSENYFKDIAKIEDEEYIVYPTYTDEEMSTLSENETDDAYVVVEIGETKTIYSLSDENFTDIALESAEDTAKITVYAKDTRDTVAITKGETSVDGTTVTTVKDDVISIKIAESEAKTITVTYTEPVVDPDETPETDGENENTENESDINGGNAV